MRPDPNTLTPFFKPESVAIICAISDLNKIGYGSVVNLMLRTNHSPIFICR